MQRRYNTPKEIRGQVSKTKATAIEDMKQETGPGKFFNRIYIDLETQVYNYCTG